MAKGSKTGKPILYIIYLVIYLVSNSSLEQHNGKWNDDENDGEWKRRKSTQNSTMEACKSENLQKNDVM